MGWSDSTIGGSEVQAGRSGRTDSRRWVCPHRLSLQNTALLWVKELPEHESSHSQPTCVPRMPPCICGACLAMVAPGGELRTGGYISPEAMHTVPLLGLSHKDVGAPRCPALARSRSTNIWDAALSSLALVRPAGEAAGGETVQDKDAPIVISGVASRNLFPYLAAALQPSIFKGANPMESFRLNKPTLFFYLIWQSSDGPLKNGGHCVWKLLCQRLFF